MGGRGTTAGTPGTTMVAWAGGRWWPTEGLGAAVMERGVMAREQHPGMQARERSLLAVGRSKCFTNMLHHLHKRLTQ